VVSADGLALFGRCGRESRSGVQRLATTPPPGSGFCARSIWWPTLGRHISVAGSLFPRNDGWSMLFAQLLDRVHCLSVVVRLTRERRAPCWRAPWESAHRSPELVPWLHSRALPRQDRGAFMNDLSVVRFGKPPHSAGHAKCKRHHKDSSTRVTNGAIATTQRKIMMGAVRPEKRIDVMLPAAEKAVRLEGEPAWLSAPASWDESRKPRPQANSRWPSNRHPTADALVIRKARWGSTSRQR